MSAETHTVATAEPDGTEAHVGPPDAPRPRWRHAQVQLTVKIAVGFVVGTVMVGVVGPIALSVIVGLCQGYHRF